MTKECIICGTTFASTRFWTKTCSKECSYELIKFNARSNSKKNYRLKNPQDRYLIDMNEIIEEKDYLKVIVYTNKNKYKGFFIADKEDLDLIKKHKWCILNDYPTTNIKGEMMKLQNLLIPHKKELIVDHVSRDRLDNRRSNLRLATYSQNSHNIGIRSNNTSGCTGVYQHTQTKKWVARIMYQGKYKQIGIFDNKQTAIDARLKEEINMLNKYSPNYKGVVSCDS